MTTIDDTQWDAGRRRAVALVTAQQGEDDGAMFSAVLDGLTEGVEVGACISFLAALAWALVVVAAEAEGHDPEAYWQRFAAATMEVHGG